MNCICLVMQNRKKNCLIFPKKLTISSFEKNIKIQKKQLLSDKNFFQYNKNNILHSKYVSKFFFQGAKLNSSEEYTVRFTRNFSRMIAHIPIFIALVSIFTHYTTTERGKNQRDMCSDSRCFKKPLSCIQVGICFYLI